VNVSSAATGMVTARNYGILSTQERELLGPKVATSIIHLYPIVLGQPVISASNIFSCGFTNSPGLSFTLLGASSLSTPLNQWTPVGGIVESPPGTYTIADSATNAARFYRVAAAP
jgi:hypothetical protein